MQGQPCGSEISNIVLKVCTGCADREAGLHSANMCPESLEEATSYILQYQFNQAAVNGKMEDRSPEVAVRSVRSRWDSREERSPSCREFRGRDVTPVRNRDKRPQNPRESADREEWWDYSPHQNRPPLKSPQERREVTPPGKRREAEPDQPE
ncbi:hypothetical protein PoB_007570000 [Plakobranchus ocellatus]|uniref:Uncharacterized protein n=1 Tax=Plakobranchus ocellatus TaxID=259542 RepID=A0AAV4DYD0_9GAST|nr:hypothetical protein PoB_007570000 [Plakobranchus ocellatus]